MSNKIINFKTIVILIFNIVLFFIMISGYKDIHRKQSIIKKFRPVTVKILEIYGGRGRSSCKVEYNNNIYNNVTLPDIKLNPGNYNNIYFYYDEKDDVIFSDNLQTRAIYLITILFVLSLLLWIIPKKYL